MNKQLILLTLGVALLLGSAGYLAMHSPQKFLLTDTPAQQEFNIFVQKYNKKFSSPEERAYRFEVFSENLNIINGDQTHTLGITPFADLTREEFAATYLTLHPPPFYNLPHKNPRTGGVTPCITDYSLSINWAAKGKVTPVKDQGKCGSSWAFASTASIESGLIVARKADNTIDLSEQYLLDCSYQQDNQGCNGGMISSALHFVSNVGIPKSSNYQPYSASKGNCGLDDIKKSDLIPIGFYNQLPYSCEGDLKNALEKNPVAVSVDASNWMLYKQGVAQCSNQNITLNHGALLVGIENNKAWIIKNSWGTGWGENGYIKVDVYGRCGVSQSAFYPYV